jgi:hypothetical protein
MNTSLAASPEPSRTLQALRRIILGIFVLGLLGTVAELLLLKHWEEPWQLVPLILIGVSLLVLGWHATHGGAASVRVFQVIMFLFMISGVAGILLHYRGRVEFKLESNPSLAGLDLFWAAMKTATPPALAPAAMIQFGLLGLASTYRHPALTASKEAKTTHKED